MCEISTNKREDRREGVSKKSGTEREREKRGRREREVKQARKKDRDKEEKRREREKERERERGSLRWLCNRLELDLCLRRCRGNGKKEKRTQRVNFHLMRLLTFSCFLIFLFL
jgi:hypothetical protein